MLLYNQIVCGKVFVAPVLSKDIPLFSHCTGGPYHFPVEVFEEHLRPILENHCQGEIVISKNISEWQRTAGPEGEMT